MTATHVSNSTSSVTPVLYLSFELSANQWKIGSSTGRAQKPRVVSISAGHAALVLKEISRAKSRFGLPEDAVVLRGWS